MSSKLLHSYIARLLKKKQYNNLTIYQSNNGLTLIELLVVIAILGILASFTSVLMIGHQKQARDAQRKNDLTQVARAMQAAKNDCKAAAYYPFGWISALVAKTAFTSVTADLKLAGYLGSTIKDPLNNGTYFYEYRPKTDYATTGGAPYHCSWVDDSSGYTSVSGTTTFVFRAKLESGASDPDSTKSFNTCSNVISTSLAFVDAAVSDDGYYYVCNN